MSELRNKLAKRIEQKEEFTDIEEIQNENKIIPLKPVELQPEGIVPEFAISLNDAKHN